MLPLRSSWDLVLEIAAFPEDDRVARQKKQLDLQNKKVQQLAARIEHSKIGRNVAGKTVPCWAPSRPVHSIRLTRHRLMTAHLMMTAYLYKCGVQYRKRKLTRRGRQGRSRGWNRELGDLSSTLFRAQQCGA